ncbi:hypothetical protein BCR36DRAFT_413757 [Piromyces finnis]|uniref:Zn(2)-C6 fungal-type domain-containing protein n=1 Tax=Piromyces finnis TaxID=1754191 RepID=A0A1Y1V5A7_9FUNG|nr:hypothetical protein BCR36DRAFT_413757 [Piromyces finnis]|eukprot:ORX47103.1 hypothetical protein BCR36DRAFT_413757 [Piromyces finnis]
MCSNSNKNRKKVSQACENCRIKKTKCSGEKPKCDKCTHLNIECIYNTTTKKRGPKIGYIEDTIQNKIRENLENLIISNQISKENIYKLAKNNYDIFMSSKILRKYIQEDKQEDKIQNTETNDIFTNYIRQKISKLKEKEYIIFKNPQKKELTGDAIIYNKYDYYKYYFIEIDYSLINIYFRYVHPYKSILIKDIVMERIRNRTIIPPLLLSIYASALMYKPNPEIKKAREYAVKAYNLLIDSYYDPNVQVIQAYTTIANCLSGTSLSWVLIGLSIKYAHILNLNKEDKNLSKKLNDERKKTFWYCFSKDILFCTITGRSYRYDIVNSDDTIEYFRKLKVTKWTIALVVHLVLIRLLLAVKHYIEESHTNTFEINLLENIIKYWFNYYESKFDYAFDYEKEETGSIILFNKHCIFFYTLKILFYRHQSSSFVTNESKKSEEKILNSSKGIGYSFTKNKLKEIMNLDVLFNYSLNFINKSYLLKDKESTSSRFNENQYNNNHNIRMDNKTKDVPDVFSLKNCIYIKDSKVKSLKIDYNLKYMNNKKNIYSESDTSTSSDTDDTSIRKKSLKRTYDESFSDNDNKLITYLKRRKTVCSIFDGFLSDNLINIKKYFKKNSNEDEVIDNKNKEEEKEDGEKFSDNNGMDNQNVNVQNYIDKIILGLNENKNKHSEEILENVFRPFDNLKPIDLLYKYFNLNTNNTSSEKKPLQENSMDSLRKCYIIANYVTEKVKEYKQFLTKNNMIMSFILSWCCYEIGIIYLIVYVDEGKKEDLEKAKFYRDILVDSSKSYLAVSTYLSKYNEILKEAEMSVKNNLKKLVIRDVF